MDAPEIEHMAQLESQHWWYRGLRDMLRRTLQVPRLRLDSAPNVLDAGCGTGANLRLLQDVLNPAYAGGFDISADAVRFCREKVGDGADVYVSDVRDPAIHVDALDLIISCDVISLSGIDESMEGLRRLIHRLRVGGLFILNLAAFRWMFSSHDVITHTRDRTSVPEVRKVFDQLDLTVEMMTYRVFSLFPAIVMARIPSMLTRPEYGDSKSDLGRGPRWINKPLAGILCAENLAIAKGIRFPWGSSVYAVGRKL